MHLYVGNLGFKTAEADLRAMFEQFGRVDEIQIVTDRVTKRSRGFAFVEMPNESEAQAAIRNLDGLATQGRELRVNEARPQGKKDPA